MEAYKKDFIEFMVRSNVLTFGSFTTKSGRQTPYFVNTGNYRTGSQIGALGEFYARAIQAALGDNFTVLFGPAYKGISLAVATAIAFDKLFRRDIAVSYNRKEAKDHGEGGNIIGHKPETGDRLVLIDDVITAGTSVRESMELLAPTGATCAALAVSVDRMEKGPAGTSALADVQSNFGMKAIAIVTIAEIVGYLHNKTIDGKVVLDDSAITAIDRYREQYGV